MISPNRTSAPGSIGISRSGSIRSPFTRVPLVLPRSAIVHAAPCAVSRACFQLTVGSESETSASGSRPTTTDGGASWNANPTSGPEPTTSRTSRDAGPALGGAGGGASGAAGLAGCCGNGGTGSVGAGGVAGVGVGASGAAGLGTGGAAGSGIARATAGGVAGVALDAAREVRSVSPTWITSPSSSRWGSDTSLRFAQVPFRLPRSRR